MTPARHGDTMLDDNAFRKFFDAGFKYLVPIIPPDAKISPTSSLASRKDARGKAVGYQRDDGTWCGFDWVASEQQTALAALDMWHAMGAGVGVRTGFGLVAIDIDSLDPKQSSFVESLAYKRLGQSCVRIGKAPKRLLPYRVTEPVPYQRVLFDDGTDFDPKAAPRVELLSEGKQFVAHGIHPGTGRPYSWPDGFPEIDQLAVVTRAQLDAFFAELAEILPGSKRLALATSQERNQDQTALKGDIGLVRKAVAAIPNTSELYPDYDSYISIAAAIKAATQDEPETGEEIFLEWCDKWTDGDNDPDRALSDYARIKPPYSIGASYLYRKASQQGGVSFSTADVWFSAITDDTPAASGGAKGASRFAPIDIFEAAGLALTESTQPLIKGLLDQNAMTVLYGDSNAGKTFVALDMAYHIWAGKPYGGLAVTQKDVVYIAAEGGIGILKRLRAIVVDKAPEPRGGFHVIRSQVNLLNADADLADLTAAIRAACPDPGLIVIDTASRALAGGDENSSTDMGAFVRNIDSLRGSCGGHIMIIHHTGKDKAKGARGHSLLRAATDTEIEVAEGRIEVTKQRDLEKTFHAQFRLRGVALGLDSSNEMATSAVIDLTVDEEDAPKSDDNTPADGALKGLRATVYEQVKAICAAAPSRNAALSAIHEGLKGKRKGGDWSEKRVSNVLSELVGLGHIVLQAPRIWALTRENLDKMSDKGPAFDVFG